MATGSARVTLHGCRKSRGGTGHGGLHTLRVALPIETQVQMIPPDN